MRAKSKYTSFKFFKKKFKKEEDGERVKLRREEDLRPRVCTPMNFKVDFFFFLQSALPILPVNSHAQWGWAASFYYKSRILPSI